MNPAATPGQAAGVPYTVPPEPSRMPATLLAVAVHAVLLAFLYVGVNWQNDEPVTVEAEVWDMRVQDAAPAPAEPPPPPPEAEPLPKVAPPPPRPEPVKEVEPPPAKPDIALERKKKELELKKQQEKEKLEKEKERERLERLAEEKKKEKEELKKKELDKKLADKEKEKKLAEQKEKEAADKKAADKLAKEKAAAEDKKLAAARAAEMARITGAAGSGTAAQSTAPRVDEGYKLAISNKIKNNTTYLGNVEGNPRVEFKVEQLPTGEIISVRKTKSSGDEGFDDAVEKGIMKSSPLPKKKDGTVDRTVTVGFKPKDLE